MNNLIFVAHILSLLSFCLYEYTFAIDIYKSKKHKYQIIQVINPYKMDAFEYLIETTWNNKSIEHDPVKIRFERINFADDFLTVSVRAPFFGTPKAPKEKPGEFFNLWDYEVVEAFFLSENTGNYLELEFGPYGHYLVLLLNGNKNVLKKGLELEYTATIDKFYWEGTAKIPESYFPLMVTKMNAYAIHCTDPHRHYEALYPVEANNPNYTNPDFHRLAYFKDIDFKKLLPNNWDAAGESHLWQKSHQ